MAQARRPYIQTEKKRSSIFYSGDRENEFSKIFFVSLGLNKGGIFQYKQTFEFSGPYSEIRLAKLTNHSPHTD